MNIHNIYFVFKLSTDDNSSHSFDVSARMYIRNIRTLMYMHTRTYTYTPKYAHALILPALASQVQNSFNLRTRKVRNLMKCFVCACNCESPPQLHRLMSCTHRIALESSPQREVGVILARLVSSADVDREKGAR